MARVRVASAQEVPTGQGRVVEAGGKLVALFNVDGAFFAIDNSCAHRGGPLAEGELEGPIVTCPWHGWRWDVRTGANANNPAVRQACFAVSVEGEELFVEV